MRVRDPGNVKRYRQRHERCEWCGGTWSLQTHHLVPRSRGGGDEDSNLMVLCVECHTMAHSVAGFNAELVQFKEG